MRRCFASILFCCFVTGNAQLPADIKFTNYTRANGLPEEHINNIIQDSRGFLWMGSNEGLIRFDGLHFKTWYANPNDSLKFFNNNIAVIAEYKPGQLLFIAGAELWQINIYNHQLQKLPQFSSRLTTTLPQKLNPSNWIVADMDSVYITGYELKPLYSLSIRKYFTEKTTVFCFPLHYPYMLLSASLSNHIYLLNYLTKQIDPFKIDDTQIDSRAKFLVPQAYDSSRRRLYLSAFFNGNFYCDLQLPQKTSYKLIPIPAQPDGAIRKSLLLPDRRMLQVGDHGLFITDFITSGTFNEKSSPDFPMVSQVVLDIYKDRDDNYWLSTINGISRFTLKEPHVGYLQKKLNFNSDDEFKSILKGRDGNIYFLAQEKSLFRIDRKTTAVKRVDSALSYCWSAVQHGDDIIATGGQKKIIRYNIFSGKISYPDFLQPFYTKNTDLVTLVYKAGNGDLWYSCNGGVGLIRNPAGTSRFIQYNKTSVPGPISLSYVHTAAEDSHGNIWWGTNKSPVLLKWNGSQQKFEEYEVGKLMPHLKLNSGITNLYVDAADNLWISLDAAALIKYNLNTKRGDYYDINRGLPTNAVFGMVSDSKNRLWFGTRKGLCCYLPDRDKVVTYTKYDGLPEDNFEGKGIFFDKEENLLYAGGRRSISFFNPDTLLNKTIRIQPPPFIDEMLVNGKPLYFENDKKIVLEPGENNIEFSFAAADFNRNNQLEFQYQLKGASNEWINLGEKRNNSFNNLPPGSYTISVRCKYKGNDAWKETTAPLSFTIKTPWYRTWWFIITCIVFSAFLTWFVIRSYYGRKIEKQKAALEKKQAIEKERTRIATDMHDDFGASLSRIKFLSEKLQLYKVEHIAEKNDLEKISSYSDEMSEKLNEIVWALNQRYDSVGDLVSFCRSYASEFLQDKNIKLLFSSGQMEEKNIQGETRRNVFLVIKESLYNIVKHAGASEVSISFSYDTNLRVVITDNGKGFDKESIRPFANGLENMKKRMKDINGSFTIETKATRPPADGGTFARGTKISLSVPI